MCRKSLILVLLSGLILFPCILSAEETYYDWEQVVVDSLPEASEETSNKVYVVNDSYYVTGLINSDKECVITISFPYDKVDILKQNPHIEYLNKEYNINSITYNDPYLNSEIPYEDINITTDLTSKDQIINLKILYNKQRVIKKIKNIIKGE